jgi:hypothetical protein
LALTRSSSSPYLRESLELGNAELIFRATLPLEGGGVLVVIASPARRRVEKGE